jgi:hypothetical protein
LDPRAHVAEFARRLEKRDAVPRVRERVGCCEAAETRADDDDVEGEGGAPAVVEGWDFLEGCVCGWVCEHVWVVFHDGSSGEVGKVGKYGAVLAFLRVIHLFPRI